MAKNTDKKPGLRKVAKTTRKTSKKKPGAGVAELRIELDNESGISDATQLHQRLLAAVDHTAKVTIDAASIERVDTAILQLLTAFVIERKRQGKAVAWAAPSEVFYQAAKIIDLAGHLDLPQPSVNL